MRFENILLEMLLEGKVEDTLARHTSISDETKKDYLRQIPANNAQHLDWILQQHSNGNIRHEHNINEILTHFNKIKDKLPKKQIHQYKSVDELHTAIQPHLSTIQKTVKEKQREGTETLYSSPTMTIKQHHNYESCVKAGVLPSHNTEYHNTNSIGKAEWCVSADSKDGLSYYHSYSRNSSLPIYTIEHHHSDGSSNKHMLVFSPNYTQDLQELRDEKDNIVTNSDNILDSYKKKYPELEKTPIAQIFSKQGRAKLKQDYNKENDRIYNIIKHINNNEPMNDTDFQHYFNEGLKQGNNAIHSYLSKNPHLTNNQVDKIIRKSSAGVLRNITRDDLSEDQVHTMITRGDNDTIENLIKNNHLSENNTNHLIKQKVNSDIHELLLDTHNLSPTNLNEIIKHTNTGNRLQIIRKKRLSDDNVRNLIHYGNSLVHNELTKTDLSNDNISHLLRTNNPVINRKLLSKPLTHEHLHMIIDNADKIDTLLPILKHPSLDDSHIKRIAHKDNDFVNSILSTRPDLSPDVKEYIKKSSSVF